MAPPTLERPPTTTLAPPCLPPTQRSPALSFYSSFSVKLLVTSTYQVDILCTTARLNTPQSHHQDKSQRVLYNRKRHTSASDTSHSQRYSFWSNFLGRSRQLEEIEIYYSLEALYMIQVHQTSYCETFMYLEVLIGQIRPTVPYPWATKLVDSSLLYHSPWNSPPLKQPHRLIRVDCTIFLDHFKNSFITQAISLSNSSWFSNLTW